MAEEYRSTCKDCGNPFGYSEASIQSGAIRGLTRPERCPECRKSHSLESRSIGIPQIAIKPIGKRKDDKELVPGRLGGIKHPPRTHEKVVLEAKFGKPGVRIDFGITDDDIRLLVTTLEKYQVAVVVGPTGSGKSTFLPYRLITPPYGIERDIFTRYGQIVITQPRIQATRTIAEFVARDLHGSSLGAGFDVGFRHSGSPNADWRNKLVFITDGTLINWIVSGQIGNLSVIMIDEAHERSLNIDLILGLLKLQLPRFPHLKLIIASATINADLFLNYYGGPEKVALLKFKGLKQHKVDAYFPDYDKKLYKGKESVTPGDTRYVKNLMAGKIHELLLEIAEGNKCEGDILGFLPGEALIEECIEDIREMIAADPVLRERSVNCYPLYSRLPIEQQDLALAQKVINIRDKVLSLVRSKDRPADRIIAVLLDAISAGEACKKVNVALEEEHLDFWCAAIIPDCTITLDSHPGQILFTSHETFNKLQNTSQYRLITDRRVILSTNMAETSLTVDGIVYVVESGLIKESSWDGSNAANDLQARVHSRAGCIQRMGRAGRVRDGEAHMLYTDEEFEDDEVFSAYAIPEIQRSAIDQVILKAKAAGVDNILEFDWIEPPPEAELKRAPEVLRSMGAIDEDGDITDLGLELGSLVTDVPIASLLLAADRFACGIEMATLAALLPMSIQGGIMVWNRNWDATSKNTAARIKAGLAAACGDDLDFLLKLYAIWAEADTHEESKLLSRIFLLNSDQLNNKVSSTRSQFLEMLAIGKKSVEDRPTNFGMLDRLRIILAVSMPDSFIYRTTAGETTNFTAINCEDGKETAVEISDDSILADTPPELFVALKRRMARNREGKKVLMLSCLVRLKPEWMEFKGYSAIELAIALGREIAPNTVGDKLGMIRHRLFLDVIYPVGTQLKAITDESGATFTLRRTTYPLPPEMVVVEGKDEQADDPVDLTSTETEFFSGHRPAASAGLRSDIADPDAPSQAEFENNYEFDSEDVAEELQGDQSGGEEEDLTDESEIQCNRLMQTAEVAAAAARVPELERLGVEEQALYQVAGHTYSSSSATLRLMSLTTASNAEFVAGDRVLVESRRTIALPGNGVALCVSMKNSSVEYIIDPENLAFAGRRELIEHFSKLPEFEMVAEKRSGGSLRLTCLPIIEERMTRLIQGMGNNRTVAARILYENKKNRFAAVLIDNSQTPPEIYWGAYFANYDYARTYQSDATYSLEIDQGYGDASVYFPAPSPELLDFVEQEKFNRKIFWNRHRSALHTRAPMRCETRDFLIGLAKTGLHVTAIKTLYLESNKIRLFPPVSSDKSEAEQLKRSNRRLEWSRKERESYQEEEAPQYRKLDTLVGTVLGLFERNVLIKLERGGTGSISIDRLAERRLLDPREEVYADQELEVVVLKTSNDAVGKPRIDLCMKGVRPTARQAIAETISSSNQAKSDKQPKVSIVTPVVNIDRTIRVPLEKMSAIKSNLEKIVTTSLCGLQFDNKTGNIYIRGKSIEKVELALAMIRERAPELELIIDGN